MKSPKTILSLLAVAALVLGSGPAHATLYTFVPGGDVSGNDWWMLTNNWNPVGTPDSVNDIVVFNASTLPAYSTNVHSNFYTVQEMRFATTSTWNMHNARQDPKLQAPSGNALVTQNGSGAVTFNTDLIFNSNVLFGGTGTGTITVNGSESASFKGTVRGTGGLTLQGNYILTLNTPVSYQGATVLNAGTLLFNGDSAAPLPGPDDLGYSVTGYTPVAMAAVTVNSAARLGGIGNVQAAVTVNSGGTFAPGSPASSPSGSRMTLASLTLAAGSAAAFDLGGTSPGNPGNSTGYYDQAAVTGQLALAGTLNVAAVTGYTPAVGSSYNLFTYGSLSPTANSFATLSTPAIPANHPNWAWAINYGTGLNSQVTLNYVNNPWYFTAGSYAYPSPNPYWATLTNWSYPTYKPGFDSANPDTVIFDDAHYSAAALAALGDHETNIHDVSPGWLREIQVNTAAASGWHFYNNDRTLALKNPAVGQSALFTQNGSGPIVVDDNVRMDSPTVFGGAGGGKVTLNGCQLLTEGTAVIRTGLAGTGNLTLNGNYNLVLSNAASYTGTTTINAGTLTFNAETAYPNPSPTIGNPATYYIPTTQGAVTVNAGGTLGGTGKLHAAVDVKAGGTLSPGSSAGIFTVDGLTLESGAQSVFELGGTTPGNGLGHYDQAVINGILQLGGTLDVRLIDGYIPTRYSTYDILLYGTRDPAHSTFDSYLFPTLPDGLLFFVSSGPAANGRVTLTVSTPEPCTLLLLGLGVAALARRRRRRTR